MLRKDVLVKRPEGTKIYRQRDCVYVYHVTGSEYKKDKKYVVEKRVCIGKMVDDENMNPNDNFYQYYEIVDGNEAILLTQKRNGTIRKYLIFSKMG